jgi:hypothetical protein
MDDARGSLEAPWFESPFFERELEKSDLDPETRALVRSFADNGYIVFDGRIEDFDRLAAEIDSGLAERFAENNRVQDAWRYLPQVRRLATEPRIKEVLEALYRRRPFPFQTINFRRGSQQPTHSDLAHFDSMPNRFMAGVWVALEDVQPDGGPLHYFPGSHRLPVYWPHELGVSGSRTNFDDVYPIYERFLGDMVTAAGLKKEILQVSKGQVVIWAANMLHGGEPITNPEATRRSQVTHFYFEGCRYWTPVRSDPPLGRIHWRRVVNVETGAVEPHHYHGNDVRLPLHRTLRDSYEYALNDPGRFGSFARGASTARNKLVSAMRPSG